MRLRRLSWAGVEIECDGETLVIDMQDNHRWQLSVAALRAVSSGIESWKCYHALLPTPRRSCDPDALLRHLRGCSSFRPEPATGDKDDSK